MSHVKPPTGPAGPVPRRLGGAIAGTTRKGRVIRIGGAAAIAAGLIGAQAFAVVAAGSAGPSGAARATAAARATTAADTVDTSVPTIAFSAEGTLWTKCVSSTVACAAGQSASQYSTNTALTIADGTSPAITYTEAGGGTYVEAFQGGNGDLWIRGALGTRDLGLAMRAGTSPAIAPYGGSAGGVGIAFQTAGGTLDRTSISAAGVVNTIATGLPMDTSSSPAVGELTTGYEVAYQTNYGHLAITGSNGVTTDTYKIMRAGTTPGITKVQGGAGAEVAFQGSDAELQTYGSLGTANLGLPMDSQSSPSIVTLTPTTYEIAYQTNYGHLAVYASSTGTETDTYQIMRAGTSPSISAFTVRVPLGSPGLREIPVQEFEVAYQTSTGVLDLDTDGTSNVNLGGGINASPATANSFRYLS